MSVVVNDDLVAQAFSLQPRPRCAKRSQANSDAKDAVHIGANRSNGSQRIVERQRRRTGDRSCDRLLRAARKTNDTAAGKGGGTLEEQTTIHDASPDGGCKCYRG